MSAELIAKYKNWIIDGTMNFAPKLLAAVLTLVIGLWLSSMIVSIARKAMTHRKVDDTLVPFVASFMGWALKALVFISAASMLGVKTTSFVAVLGAAGLAVGLALQGSLANFAGGVLILIFRPYRVGDLIEAQGVLGVVKEVQIFTTTLTSPQNRRIIIPNGAISNGNIVNLSAEDHVRVDTVVGISYGDDMDKAREVLLAMLARIPKALQDPAPVVEVMELGDSSVNFAVRPFCNPADYWDVYFATMYGAKRALDEAGISIPFPQRDVHLFQAKG